MSHSKKQGLELPHWLSGSWREKLEVAADGRAFECDPAQAPRCYSEPL